MQLKTCWLDGKAIGYSDETEFLIQVGKGKSAYKTRHTIKGNFGQAFITYQGINIGYGYKKRLYMPSCSKRPVIARSKS